MFAVVAGLTLSGVATLCHDIWANVIRGGNADSGKAQGGSSGDNRHRLPVILGILFEGQNVAFMAALAFSIACAANFPSLVLAITWKRFTTAAAVSSILTGTLSSVVLILLSSTVQVDVLGNALPNIVDAWWFVPLKNPAIVCMPLSFVVAVGVSLLTNEKDADRTFNDRMLLGPFASVTTKRNKPL
jgi:cation/acetate symporter